jgi:UPF0755 protein
MTRFWAAIVVLIFSGFIAGSLFFGVPSRREPVTVAVASGEGALTIGRRLKEARVVRSAWAFVLVARAGGSSRRLQAGEYTLPPKLSLLGVVGALKRAPSPNEVAVTIVEGSTLREIAQTLAALELVSEESFLAEAIVSQYRAEFQFLSDAPADATLEGYLFPDTYRFFRKTSADEIIRKLLARFGEQFDVQLRERNRADGHSIFDAVSMASIIEREVRTDPDRAKVADIFWKRLAAGIPLQADSTVNYVTGKKTPGISLDDRDIDSLWNTYRYRGLPKGPISNPGRAALIAAVNPQPNQYWYFLTTPEGEVIYSKTNDEHAAAKRKYLK